MDGSSLNRGGFLKNNLAAPQVYLAITASMCLWLSATTLTCQVVLSDEPDTTTASTLAAEIHQEIHAAAQAGKLAGAAHLVVKDGRELLCEVAGVCDVEEARPFERDTILRIYSMSKPITSVAAMTLYEQGKFALDDPVAKFIPAFSETLVLQADADQSWKLVAANRPISVRDVFRHTTGYAYGGGDNAELERRYAAAGLKYRPPAAMMPPEMSIEEAANALAGIPALHHPGARFTYGFSTDLLGRLIEVWSGETLDAYLKSAIFDPLEMTDTAFQLSAEQTQRLASCHAIEAGKLTVVDPAASSPFATGFAFLSGGGGLLSTIDDYGRFCRMLVDGGQYNGRRILDEETLQLMFTNQLQDAAGDFQFGLGFAINQITLGRSDSARQAMQFSWGGYASTDFKIVPEEKLYQVFVRQEVPSNHELANKLIRQVNLEL